MTASTSKIKDEVTILPAKGGTDAEIVENGGVSPQPSMKTEDDACSEIIRIEQDAEKEETLNNTAFGRFVQTLQVKTNVCMHRVFTFSLISLLFKEAYFARKLCKLHLFILVRQILVYLIRIKSMSPSQSI